MATSRNGQTKLEWDATTTNIWKPFWLRGMVLSYKWWQH